MIKSKNPYLKKAGEQQEYTPAQIKELAKCMNDPIYFIKKYCQIQHPVRGAIPFKLYPYQEQLIRAFHENRNVICLSARQTGKSQCSAAFILWYAIFHFDKTILIASNKNSNAMEMIQRIRFSYERLPHWIKPGLADDGWNKHNVGFDNNSRIISTATSETAGRGMAISLLFLDEFSFVPPGIQDLFWASMSPTLSTGGSCIICSTPNGDSDLYAQLWRGANIPQSLEVMTGINGFYPIEVKWDEPPGRDEKFKKEELAKIGEVKWRQEYLCEFISSDPLLFDTLVLANITAEISKIQPEKIINDVVFFEQPKPGKTYLVSCDPSTGTGKDFAVIEVFSFPELVQVAEWRSNTMSSSLTYHALKKILMIYSKLNILCYWTVENNGVGEGILTLFENDDNFPEMSEFVSETGQQRKGMTSTGKSKIRSCVSIKELIERGVMKIRSRLLLGEMKNFVRSKGSYNAKRGCTDDAISATLLIVRMLEELSTYEQAAYDKLILSQYMEEDTDYTDWDDDYVPDGFVC